MLELAGQLRLLGGGSAVRTAHDSPSVTVRVVIARYLRHAEERYRKPDGTTTTSLGDARQALRVLRHLYDETPAAAFGPKALKAVRQAMVNRRWSRPTIAKRIGTIRQMFKWAASEELIPASVPAPGDRRLCDEASPPPEHLRRRRIAAGGRKRTQLEPLADWRERLGDKGRDEVRAWREVHRWHPNQLRHAAATTLRREFGIEAARVIFGHTTVAMAENYAGRDLQAAREIARKIG